MHGQVLGRHRSAPAAGSGKLALKLGLCVCAGQLIAGPLMAGAADAAVGSATATKTSVQPRVAETVSHSRVNAGTLVRVWTRVIDPRTHRGVTSGSVQLQYKRGSSWHTTSTRRIVKNGLVQFRIRPSTTMTLRSHYMGSSAVRARNSNVVKVTAVRSSRGAAILAEARRHVGARYKFGASGPSRFDCSGFTMYVFRKSVGRSLPHKADGQQRYGNAVSKSAARPGDLIVFRSGSYGYHAGVYAGGGYMYDSPHTGAKVGRHKIFSNSYVVRRLA